MNLAQLLEVMDGTENIIIVDYNNGNTRKKIYGGMKQDVMGLDYSSRVIAVYTVKGIITIGIV